MNELLKKVEDGVQPASWDDFLQFTGQDAWIDCMEIVRASMTDNYVVETRMSDQCITDYPEDTWDFYHYCQDNADHGMCPIAYDLIAFNFSRDSLADAILHQSQPGARTRAVTSTCSRPCAARPGTSTSICSAQSLT